MILITFVSIKVSFGSVKVELLQLKEEVSASRVKDFDHFDVQLIIDRIAGSITYQDLRFTFNQRGFNILKADIEEVKLIDYSNSKVHDSEGVATRQRRFDGSATIKMLSLKEQEDWLH